MRSFKVSLNCISLDAPYAPLNDLIAAEQKAGKLVQVEPRDEDDPRSLLDAIRIMRKYRMGARNVGNYYTKHPEETGGTDLGPAIEMHLNNAFNKTYKTIPRFVVLAAMLVWRNSADIIRESENYGPLNDLITKLDVHGLIHTSYSEIELKKLAATPKVEDLSKNEEMGRELLKPLTLRQALTVLDQNIGGCTKVANHLIENKMTLQIDLTDPEIKRTTGHLRNFMDGLSAYLRSSDLEVLIAGYRGLAINDEILFGIVWKTKNGSVQRPAIPMLRRWDFQDRVDNTSPFNDLSAEQTRVKIGQALRSLTPRQQNTIKLRFLEEETLDAVGEIFQVPKDNVRRIEAQALRALRHPSRSRQLRLVM